MDKLPNPHDRFYKELFSQPDTVADFVRHYLPEHLVAAIDLASLEIVKESFVDEELRQYFSDVLFGVKLKRGGEAFIYILLESLLRPPRERIDRRGEKAYFSAQFQISLLSQVELRPSSFVVRDQWQ